MILLPKRNLASTLFSFHIFLSLILKTQAKCNTGCHLAIGSYYVRQGTNLSYISDLFSQQVPEILKYNPKVSNKDSINTGTRLNVPFSCDCLNGDFLGHTFTYITQFGDTYDSIAKFPYSNLTNKDWLQRVNSYQPTRIPDYVPINVTVNCSCGDRHVSKDYALFATYPLRPGEDLSSVAAESGVPAHLLELYNPGSNFSAGNGLVFVPAKDEYGNYPPLKRKKKVVEASTLPAVSQDQYVRHRLGSGSIPEKASESATFAGAPSQGLTGITVDKSVEFSYEELAKATKDFSQDNKIGQGGFGSVYYAKLRGEVRLIGYCVEGSLFLVYEYIENGNLSQHLRGSGRDPLPWQTRVKIALDSARGLEYIHEHTVPVYIHRDIKSANILIDKNFRGKVADFGLTKLTEYGSTSLPSRLVDVYAFGVVLYELISGKEAIVKTNEYVPESIGLVALFEDVLSQSDSEEDLRKLVDPRLGDNCPFDSVRKLIQLAKACTQETPQLRPSMRSIVVALMTLSSSTEDWDVGSFYENHALVHLMTGR
ncbi:chitin elicitor receptor kinase 1 [Quercus suber]|uniref:Chitin elicitor receptor kinase 1 n=1 Tax=Quercus suber TaxID=58331 RepID=A0AAW0L4Z8_QUESU